MLETIGPDDLWSFAHLAGGAVLAFVFSRFARIEPPWRYVAAFALVCTASVGWEAAEFAIDQVAGTDLQLGNLDTMTDLLLGASGAAGYLSFAAIGWKAPGGR
jgi:hypothetical protein